MTPELQGMKPIAIVLAAITLVGSLAATVFAWFVVTFPFENTTPDDQHPAAFVVPGAVAFVCACCTLAWIASDRVHLALAAYAVQVVAGFILLMQAVGASDHATDGWRSLPSRSNFPRPPRWRSRSGAGARRSIS